VYDLDPQSPPDPSGYEEHADLSGLDDVGLDAEARREKLRDRRQARKIERAGAALDGRRQLVSIVILALAALGAMSAVVVGLARESDELVRAGLLALAGIYGASLVKERSDLQRRR
jgi:hypothetical protein